MLLLRADTSGKDTDLVRVAGCYIAHEKKWKIFDRKWRDALEAAKVTEFHATDFYNFRRQFKGWDKDLDRHIRFAKRFTRIAATRTLVGFSHGVEVEPFNRLIAPILKGLKSSPHDRFTPLMLCSTQLLHYVGKTWQRHFGPIAVLFEEEEGIGEMIEYFNYIKRNTKPKWIEPFVTIGTGPKSILGLQAADLLAHESWRRIKEHLQPTGRQLRKSFKCLLNDGKIAVRLTSETELTAMVPTIQRYMAAGTLD